MKTTITVLMSTYNGTKYLREQIDSILNQKDVEVRLIVRDDGSKDDTVKLLKEYQDSHKNIIIEKTNSNLGPCGSFLLLISKYKDDEYFALADQDDIWDEDKLLTAIRMIKKNESNELPVLYYSNLRIVSEDGEFCRVSHKTPHIGHNRYSALIENLATGCTIVYNKRLAEIAVQVKPTKYLMHDAWLYAVAKVFGKTVYDFQPHISYRQHGNNQIGTYERRINLKKVCQEFNSIARNNMPWSHNADIFEKQFSTWLNEEEKRNIEKIVKYHKKFKYKVELIFDKDFYPDNIYRKCRLMVEIIFNWL